MGGPRRSGPESVDALEEAIEVIRLMWSGERSISFEGRHYRLDSLHPGPQPSRPIGIWVGAYGPRMVRLVGRLADGWIPSIPRMPLEDVGPKQEAIDEAARAAGRDPGDILRLANVNGLITDGEPTDFLDGPVEHWVERLVSLVRDHRFEGFILWPKEDPIAQIERFAREVVPAVRAELARS
jgi:alkanesulfonate monooxygenase SsuD/methylene tetrahydromethanopterin reductase-like flavin-dependent oxidoreductase (luciferase family)